MNYELWSLSSRNIIADFETEQAALQTIARIVQQHGHDAVADLLLGREDDEGESHLVAQGKDLADRALAASDLPHVPG